MARVSRQRKTPDLPHSRDASLLWLPGSGATPQHYPGAAPEDRASWHRPSTGAEGRRTFEAITCNRPPRPAIWRCSGPAAAPAAGRSVTPRLCTLRCPPASQGGESDGSAHHQALPNRPHGALPLHDWTAGRGGS